MVLWILLLLLAAALAVILIRTLHFTPKAEAAYPRSEAAFDREAAVSALQQLIRCKTVSFHDKALEDDAEFEKLISLLPKLYPHVFEAARGPGTAVLLARKGPRRACRHDGTLRCSARQRGKLAETAL